MLGRLNTTVSADDASGAGIELNLDSSNREFDRMHKGTGFPITVVGTAVWKDLAPQPARLVGAVDTTGAKVTLLEEESTELRGRKFSAESTIKAFARAFRAALHVYEALVFLYRIA